MNTPQSAGKTVKLASFTSFQAPPLPTFWRMTWPRTPPAWMPARKTVRVRAVVLSTMSSVSAKPRLTERVLIDSLIVRPTQPSMWRPINEETTDTLLAGPLSLRTASCPIIYSLTRRADAVPSACVTRRTVSQGLGVPAAVRIARWSHQRQRRSRARANRLRS